MSTNIALLLPHISVETHSGPKLETLCSSGVI
jgi:hypothetical protein